ncbi:MAG: VOC family protein [Oceanicaulis sp.]
MALYSTAMIALALTGAEPGTVESVRVRRPSLMVSDLERAKDLYADVLGFEFAPVSTLAPGASAYAVFGASPDATLRFSALDTDEKAGALGLLEVTGAPLPDGGRAVIVLDAGERFDAIREGVLALGLTATGVSPLGEGREMAFSDFDGNRLYIFETP